MIRGNTFFAAAHTLVDNKLVLAHLASPEELIIGGSYFSCGEFARVVGACSEPSLSISGNFTDLEAVKEGWQQGGLKKGNAAVPSALGIPSKRMCIGLRTVVSVYEGQVCFIVPILATLMVWYELG